MDIKKLLKRPFVIIIIAILLLFIGGDIYNRIVLDNNYGVDLNKKSSPVNYDEETLKMNQERQRVLDSIKSLPKKYWITQTFVDDFGDETEDKYISTTTTGLFSNSATDNSDLYVKILIAKNSIGILLREYDITKPAEKFIGSGTIYVKNDHNYKETFLTYGEWNNKGGIKLDPMYYEKFIEFLKKSSGFVKFSIKDSYSSSYNFSINTEGFSEKYKELKEIE